MPSRHRRGLPDEDLERGVPRRTVTGRNPHVGRQCPEPGCGAVDQGEIAQARGDARPRVPRGWIYVNVRDSTLPARWYCSPPCAATGIALAQLRLTPLLDK